MTTGFYPQFDPVPVFPILMETLNIAAELFHFLITQEGLELSSRELDEGTQWYWRWKTLRIAGEDPCTSMGEAVVMALRARMALVQVTNMPSLN